MTQIGCLLWVWLLATTLGIGYAAAIREQAGFLLGVGWGVSTWLAAVGGYLCVLSVVDWRRARSREMVGVPRGVVPAIWLVFVVATAIAIRMAQRLFGGGP